MRRLIISLLASCAFAFSATAAPVPGEAQRVVEDTASRMQKVLRDNREVLARDESQIYDYVSDILLPHFDFAAVAQLVLGSHWRQATAEQRQLFTSEFRTLMVRTYGKALLEYADWNIHYLPVRPSKKENRVTVRAQVKSPSGQAVPIDYTMCHSGNAWKVCNITIDRSINFVVNYREQIGSQVRSQGLDNVIAQLSARNARPN